MRLNRGTLIFVVVLALVIVAAALLLRGDDATETPDVDAETAPTTEPQLVFPNLTTDAVTAISLNRRVEDTGVTPSVETVLTPTAVSLVYANETWSLASPDSSGETREIDQTRVEQAISTLLGLRYRETFETDNLAQFGLDAPAYDVNFTAGGTNYRLQVGNKNPGGTQYYALVGDDGKVYLLTSSASVDMVLNLVNTLPYVIPPTPTPVPVLQAPGPVFVGLTPQSINTFTLTDTTTGEELVLVRDPATLQWTIAGSAEPVLQQLVDFVLQQFTMLATVDKVPGTNLAALGLENPSRLIVAGINDTENHVAAIGNTDPTGTRYYARINAYADIAVIPVETIDFIFDMLENPPIAPEATPEVTGEATAEATESAEATSEATAEAMAESTQEATAEATIEVTEAMVETTVEATEAVVEVTVEATAEVTAEVTPEMTEAVVEATEEITPEMTEAVVEATAEATEIAAVSEYPLVFADVTADSVTELTIAQVTEEGAEPVSVTFAQDAEGNWTDSEGNAVEETLVTDIINTLLSLDVRRTVERDDLAPFGLDAPPLQITLTADDESYELQLGKRSTSGTAYALVGDDGLVYLVGSAAQVRALLDLLAPPTE
jgi:hypothetical protein